MVKPGDLNERISILQKTETRDATTGQPIRAWAPIDTVWAQVVRAPAPSLLVALQMTAIPPAVVTIRYYSALDEIATGGNGKFAIALDDGTRMAIDGLPINLDGRKRFHTFAVKRMLPTD